MKKYRARISDKILSKKLSSKGAVLIEGAKWCGKTTTASQVAKSILKMQDPAEREQNIRMSEINPSRLLAGKTPRLIDEWQLAPKLWDAIRYEVDERDEFNQFLHCLGKVFLKKYYPNCPLIHKVTSDALTFWIFFRCRYGKFLKSRQELLNLSV